jgi:hypothetical protein
MFNLSQGAADAMFGWANIILIVGAALVLIGTMGAIWTGGIRERYAAERRSTNEAKTAQALADAAKANAISESAKAESARANERTAEFEVKSQAAKIELERERIARLKLEERLRPRGITPAERQTLLSLLKAAPKGRVLVVPKTFDEEAESYAAAIQGVLRDAGYTIEALKGQRPMSLGTAGAFIWVRDFSKPPPHAAEIQHAFKEIGVTLPGYANPEIVSDADVVLIGVGVKP